MTPQSNTVQSTGPFSHPRSTLSPLVQKPRVLVFSFSFNKAKKSHNVASSVVEFTEEDEEEVQQTTSQPYKVEDADLIIRTA